MVPAKVRGCQTFMQYWYHNAAATAHHCPTTINSGIRNGINSLRKLATSAVFICELSTHCYVASCVLRPGGAHGIIAVGHTHCERGPLDFNSENVVLAHGVGQWPGVVEYTRVDVRTSLM
jgi:hypothetical protein